MDKTLTPDMRTATYATLVPVRRSRLKRLRESDLWFSFRSHPSAIFAAGLLTLIALTAFLAPWITPQNPYDLSSLELWNSEIPPIWNAEGQWPYILGTDTQGRDILSAILIVAPLLAPVAVAMGVDPTHLAIIFIVNLEIGYLTPPLGLNLFVSSTMFKSRLDK